MNIDTSLLLITAFCGIWQFVSTTDFSYTLNDTLGQPVFVGVLLGLLVGQAGQDLVIRGSLELVCLGIIYPRGTVPACAPNVALVAIPIALRTGLDARTATVLAVPSGILGPILWNVKYSINLAFTIRIQESVENGNHVAATRSASVYPLILTFFLTAIPIFFANILTPTLVEGVINSIPTWAIHGIKAAGDVLLATGSAMAIYTVGKMEFLPLFVTGYFLIIYLEIVTMGVTIFGTCTALLYLFLRNKKEREV